MSREKVMIHIIWASLMLVSILFSIFSGNLSLMTEAIMDGAKEAVNLCIVMAAVVGLWSGIMEIGVESGLIDGLADKMKPFLDWLFPNLKKKSEAKKYIAANFAANILGLGWAATPAGLKAMEELKQEEEKYTSKKEDTGQDATDEMCTFIVMNVSSLQLIPLTIIVYRSQYGSANPSFITVSGLIATAASTLTAIVYCKWKSGRKKVRKHYTDYISG